MFSTVGLYLREIGSRFFGKRRGGHLFVFALFILLLSLCLEFKQAYIGHLELNKQAEDNIISSVPFSFPDIEATSLIKQEAVRDITHVYALRSKEIIECDRDIEKDLIEERAWQEIDSRISFEEFYECKNFLRDELFHYRFAKKRMIQKMQEYGFSMDVYIACDLAGIDAVILPEYVWQEIGKRIFSLQLFSEPVIHYVIQKFQAKKWSLWEDFQVQNKLRQEIKMSISLKSSKVKEGFWIIRAGEKATSRHLDMMKAYRNAVMNKENRFSTLSFLGSMMMAFGLTVPGIMYIYVQQPRVIKSFRRICLLATIVILSVFLAKLTEHVVLHNLWHLNSIFSYPIFVLFGGVLTCLLLGMEIAFLVSIFLTGILGISFVAPHDYFSIMNLVACCIGILTVRQIRHRKDIFQMCLKVWVAMVLLIFAINFFEGKAWNYHLWEGMVLVFLFVGITAVAVVGILPVLESTFGILTGMTLMEYNNPSHPIIRTLSLEAPGTYQHSLNVGELAEAAAIAIGANGLFCKIAAIYHDIGKIKNPNYFSENQLKGFNMHILLSPLESAQIILSHVPDGVAMAHEHNLPKSFINIIKEHHGTSLLYCFYIDEIKRRGDTSLVDVQKFRYKGPKPYSKESTIIMIADIVEAAFSSSTFEEFNETILVELVEKMVSKKITDGQFSSSMISFQELEIVKRAIVQKLLGKKYKRAPILDPEGVMV